MTFLAMVVQTQADGPVRIITICRPQARNAVDRETAEALSAAFRGFESDDDASVAVLTGAEGHFCAGADLTKIAAGAPNRLEPDGDGPMGPSRMQLSKPVIAAVEGYAVAGGLELAIWCDLRVVSRAAVLGVYCRRYGVPLIDGGTVRLPQLIGLGRALDLILTGRSIDAQEASRIGLADRLAEPGQALADALVLATTIATHPQACLRADLQSARAAFGLPLGTALAEEFRRGQTVLSESVAGAQRFAARER